MAKTLTGDRALTSFDEGVKRFTWLMMKFMAVMVLWYFSSMGLPSTIGREHFSSRWPWRWA